MLQHCRDGEFVCSIIISTKGGDVLLAIFLCIPVPPHVSAAQIVLWDRKLFRIV